MAAHWLEVTHEARAGPARAGVLHTGRGAVETPALCLVGEGGSVGGATPAELRGLGVGVLLARVYELLSWPGPAVVRGLGGVHALAGWDGPIVTDSGAAEVFALGGAAAARGDGVDSAAPPVGSARRARGQPARLVRVDDDGATYTSPHDGAPARLTPESAIAAQVAFGGDIMTALDRPAPQAADEQGAARAVAQSHAWARRCLAARAGAASGQALYGVVQGGPFAAIQAASAATIASLPFDGAVVGVGDDSGASLAAIVAHLPPRWPRRARADGALGDLASLVNGGIDLVECAAPVRLGQRGLVYAGAGVQAVRDSDWREDTAPIDGRCACYTCQAPFARGYLHHLFACDELLGYTLATLHNIHTAVQVMRAIRAAIVADGRAGRVL